MAQVKEQAAFILARIRSESFMPDYQATDEECAGLMLARIFEWDGLAILRAAAFALEDANFHTEAALVNRMAEQEAAR